MPKTRTLDYEFAPTALRPPSLTGGTISLNTDTLGQIATLELSQTSPVIMGLGLAIYGLLQPGDQLWRWRDAGPGIGREVRRAMSGLFGRFVARWYLTTYHMAGAFVPIDRDEMTVHIPSIGSWIRLSRRAGETGDLPDWLWAGVPGALGGQPCMGFLEAKGTYYTNQIVRSLAGAHTQLAQLVMHRGPTENGPWTLVSCKNWAVGSGWATRDEIKRGFVRPKLRVEDPQTEGELLDNDAACGFFLSVARAQLAQTLDGLGAPTRSDKLRSLISMPISRASDLGRRAAIWRRNDSAGSGRELVGVSVQSLYAGADGERWVAGVDSETCEMLVSSDDIALKTIESFANSFVVLPEEQVTFLGEDGHRIIAT
jgi:hypothetical protein